MPSSRTSGGDTDGHSRSAASQGSVKVPSPTGPRRACSGVLLQLHTGTGAVVECNCQNHRDRRVLVPPNNTQSSLSPPHGGSANAVYIHHVDIQGQKQRHTQWSDTPEQYWRPMMVVVLCDVACIRRPCARRLSNPMRILSRPLHSARIQKQPPTMTSRIHLSNTRTNPLRKQIKNCALTLPQVHSRATLTPSLSHKG